MIDKENFMRRCLELGRIALDHGDASVGSLIILSGKIIAEGIESVKSKNDPKRTLFKDLILGRVLERSL